MRVLVADDDMTSRRILTAILRKWGHDPVVFEDGAAAWEALEKDDGLLLVLLDWNMPGLEGPEICRRLRQRVTANPPYVVLLTARGSKDDIVRGLDAGANDYIAKPYDVEELRARIGVGVRMLDLQAELVRARDSLARLALVDGLTGIRNRRAILDELKTELSRARRERQPLSVGMCDIDHFKRVNDAYGHPAGDEVLSAFARMAQGSLREHDRIGRYGGEEFLVIAPGARGEPGERVYERLLERAASTPVQTASGAVSYTISIGVAGTDGTDTIEDLISTADAALYRAKAEGRNRVFYA